MIHREELSSARGARPHKTKSPALQLLILTINIWYCLIKTADICIFGGTVRSRRYY